MAAALGRWRRARPEPAAGLGDLEAALACEGCPICARTIDADERWLDHFLYEGYQEREAMRAVARGGGFCVYHARRVEAIGLSASVALVYLALIEECLPRLAGRLNVGGRHPPLVAAPDACEACAQAREVERRECFFLALLIGARPPDRYGNPATVCMPHLPRLAEYLGDGRLAGVLAIHRTSVARLKAGLQDAAAPRLANDPEGPADRAIRAILGPAPRPAMLRLDRAAAEYADEPDPVRRMRRRLRRLQRCAICAEIEDACAEWLGWLVRAAESAGDLSDVLPLCRHHVWQARFAGGPALAPALAGVVADEAEERLVYAGMACESAPRSMMPLRWSGSAPRAAVPASLRRGRECPLCRRAREAGERAILLLAALLEETAGRRAFEGGYGLCVRHAAQALALPDARPASDIIASTMHARLALLSWELDEQLRRGAWQARPERRGAESAAWLRAGARFAGTVRAC